VPADVVLRKAEQDRCLGIPKFLGGTKDMQILSIRRNDIKVLIRLAVFVSVAVVFIIPGPARGEDDVQIRFRRLFNQYGSISNVHLEAVLHGRWKEASPVGSGSIVKVEGVYKYWAQGDYYRIISSDDPVGNPDSDFDVAWNGERDQRMDRTQSLLWYNRRRRAVIPGVHRNPLFLPLLFMSEEDDNHLALYQQLSDVQNTNKIERILSQVRAVAPVDGTAGLVVAQVPGTGGTFKHRPFVFRVYFGNNPDYMPVRVERIDNNGKVISSVEVEQYEPMKIGNAQMYWPKRTRFRYYVTESGETVEDGSEDMTLLEINRDLPADIFTIDFNLANVVRDSDARLVVKGSLTQSEPVQPVNKHTRNRLYVWAAVLTLNFVPLILLVHWLRRKIARK